MGHKVFEQVGIKDRKDQSYPDTILMVGITVTVFHDHYAYVVSSSGK